MELLLQTKYILYLKKVRVIWNEMWSFVIICEKNINLIHVEMQYKYQWSKFKLFSSKINLCYLTPSIKPIHCFLSSVPWLTKNINLNANILFCWNGRKFYSKWFLKTYFPQKLDILNPRSHWYRKTFKKWLNYCKSLVWSWVFIDLKYIKTQWSIGLILEIIVVRDLRNHSS